MATRQPTAESNQVTLTKQHQSALLESTRTPSGRTAPILLTASRRGQASEAVEFLASTLGARVHTVDLTTVVSKYIGETEKNLRRVFDAAGGSGVILLFEEADALFGKRTDVKDSHDRYANVEISYLLKRAEAYRGLVVLTTNHRSSLDAAYGRRFRVITLD